MILTTTSPNPMKDTISIGTAKRLSTLNIPLSAKTGTVGASDGSNTDAWCISYNPQYTVGAWFGNTQEANHNLLPTQNGGTIATNLNKTIWECLIKKFNITKSVCYINFKL